MRVVNSLVDMYAKCGSMDDAWRVFNKMPSRDVVTWTAVLGGCALHGHGVTIALQHIRCGTTEKVATEWPSWNFVFVPPPSVALGSDASFFLCMYFGNSIDVDDKF